MVRTLKSNRSHSSYPTLQLRLTLSSCHRLHHILCSPSAKSNGIESKLQGLDSVATSAVSGSVVATPSECGDEQRKALTDPEPIEYLQPQPCPFSMNAWMFSSLYEAMNERCNLKPLQGAVFPGPGIYNPNSTAQCNPLFLALKQPL